ncbi:MAG: TonB-dependent receptor [Gammaproteobacteria bacterium]|nr:TonB-dependent receptor [Gammaproteobacteria bacterium]
MTTYSYSHCVARKPLAGAMSCAFALGLISTLHTTVTYAQGAVIEEMVVTAQKREQNLQDVPISITAISGEQLEARGIEGLESLSSLAPNLQVNRAPGNSLTSQVSIRGSVTGQTAIYVDPAVGMYVDGVYIGKAQGSMFDLLDLERVEVLRGPQGTLFGRNTLGGAISFITRKPTGEWDGSASVDIGNNNSHIEKLSLDLPKWGIASVNLSARNEEAGGWMSNRNGKDEGSTDRQSFRGAVRLDLSSALTLDYAYDYSTIDETQTPSTLYSTSGSVGSISDLGNILLGTGTRLGIPSLVQSGNFLLAAEPQMAPYVSRSRPGSMASDTSNENVQRLNVDGQALTLSYELNETNTLKYIGSIRNMWVKDRVDMEGTPVELVKTGRNSHLDSSSHEIQWIGEAGRLNYVGGLYYYEEDGINVGGQLIMLSPPPANAKYVAYKVGDTAKAVFGQLDYALTDALTLTAGLRWTTEERRNNSAQFATMGYRGPIIATILPWTKADESWDATTPVFAATYAFNDDLTLYARFAKGFRAGGFSGEVPTVAGVTTPVDPEESTTYELGFKSTLADGIAQFNAAVFRNEITDMQLSRLLAGSTASILSNAGEATMQGVELEGVVLLGENWKLQGSYGYLHGEFDEYMDYPYNAATAALAGVSMSTLINTGDNRVFPYAPEHTLNLVLDGKLLDTEWGQLRGLLEYQYSADFYAYASNKSLTVADAGAGTLARLNEIPGVERINARLTLADMRVGGPGAANVSLWVRNLADSKQLANPIDFSYFQNATWVVPRTYGVNFDYKW